MDKGRIITLSVEVYEQLIERSQWLQCLEDAGVDNWGAYDEAQKLWRERFAEEEEDD